jgi:hypothetical protein
MSKEIYNPNTQHNIENRKRKKRSILEHDRIIVADREGRVPGNTIYLSSEECSEVSEQTRPKVSRYDNFDILVSSRLFVSSFYQKYQDKSKNGTKKRKQKIRRSKKEPKEFKKVSMYKLKKDEFLIDPVCKYME